MLFIRQTRSRWIRSVGLNHESARFQKVGAGCGRKTAPVSEDLHPFLISVLVTEIQQRRVCGAGGVHSAQGLGLAGSL
ncbi:hypothetical protein GOA59_16655 [Sinorhizobium meliloti]|uniref:Uncharacterized protein n=1 Tax=Rhizobium meliloti TaxID=382 RepID=A0AAW9TXZ3_RHIML|nr:hypothetical protein SMRU11_19180 [Sinorhizobium meliloti RU11/001]ASJ58678.1 hypothetical protein SMB554_05475 [Sinorhizobium meliloti]ASP50759.1 hypothetical protein CDO31_03690 [Sinorhizobium meliloti]ASP57284.1 hypothetical protein CDO30_02530 [Sinorhizobium meliloti]ASP64350.1 hypothetical protein CDO29_06965 [Sinorhizobium meliloti]